MCDPILDPGCRKNSYKKHNWDKWGDMNTEYIFR